ncbi:MAG: acylneuraminate cytidylyltransferase family protein [Betaproteobacteria bacterium]|nr:MAG: acylneuraminate cytidylyltransferase family protein [Betaproteobacteria bacterium]
MLGIVPARGGSKGIPRKNLALLDGRPLIAWTIESALESGAFERLIVSTDDSEIAEVARREGADVPFLRPAEFAGDVAPAIGVIRHALDALGLALSDSSSSVAYLQPTSPFRTAAQLSEVVTLFENHRPDTLVSVQRVPHNMVPGAQMVPLGQSHPLWLESPADQVLRRQEKAVAYARNGPAILIVSARDVLEHGRLYGERVLGYEMDRLSSLDIDDPLDLDMARALAPLAKLREAQ